MLLADRGYDADWIRDFVRQRGAWANIPPRFVRTVGAETSHLESKFGTL
jgi:transposase